jgi:hypothetical protein
MAKNLDEYSPRNVIFDPRLKLIVKDYLDSDVPTLLNGKKWGSKQATDMTLITHILLKFCMLDRLMDAFALPLFDGLTVVERSEFPEFDGRFGERVSADKSLIAEIFISN